ncbi:hypothetical protein IMZ48_13110 [Candidatus Bathyarchaeota archaeon]|nr:hypothetical protein [Candidatus Bathyarchaeota archaeon]
MVLMGCSPNHGSQSLSSGFIQAGYRFLRKTCVALRYTLSGTVPQLGLGDILARELFDKSCDLVLCH